MCWLGQTAQMWSKRDRKEYLLVCLEQHPAQNINKTRVLSSVCSASHSHYRPPTMESHWSFSSSFEFCLTHFCYQLDSLCTNLDRETERDLSSSKISGLSSSCVSQKKSWLPLQQFHCWKQNSIFDEHYWMPNDGHLESMLAMRAAAATYSRRSHLERFFR